MAYRRNKVEDIFKQRTHRLMLRIDRMGQTLVNRYGIAAPSPEFKHQFEQTNNTSDSETQGEEQITPTVLTNVEPRRYFPRLSLPPESQAPLEWVRDITLQTDQLEQIVGNLSRDDALHSVSINPVEPTNTSDSEKSDSLSQTSEEEITPTVSINFEAIRDSPTLPTLQDDIAQTDSSDFEAIGDSPTPSLQNLIAQTNTPHLKSPSEWVRDVNLRFDQADQNLDSLLTGDDSLSVLINRFIKNHTCEEQITATITTDIEAIDDSRTLSLQDDIAKTEASFSKSPLEWGRGVNLRFDQVDQNLLRGEDSLLAFLNQFEQTNTSDSEKEKSDSLSRTSEEEITPTVSTNFEAIGDSPPPSLQDDIAETDSSDIEAIGDSPPLDIAQIYPPESQTPMEWAREIILRFQRYHQNLVLRGNAPPSGLIHPFKQTDIAFLKSPLEWGRDIILQTDLFNQILDNLSRDNALPAVSIYPVEQTNTSDSEKSDSEEEITPTVSTNFDSPPLLLLDVITQTETTDFEAIDDTPPLLLLDMITQTDEPDFMLPMDWIQFIMFRMSKLEYIQLVARRIDQKLDDLVRDAALQPVFMNPTFIQTNTSDSLTLEDAIMLTTTTNVEAIGDSPPLSLQDVITQTETTDLEGDKGDSPPLDVRHCFVQTNTSDSETQGDDLSLTFEVAITQTVTSDFEAMGDSPPLSLQDAITQTDTTDSETGYSPSLALQDLEVQQIQKVPGLRGKESKAVKLPVQQEVQELPEIRGGLDLTMDTPDLETGYSPSLTIQDLEVQEVPGIQAKESKAVKLPVQQEVQELPEIREGLDLAMESEAMKWSTVQAVPVLREVQEFLEAQMEKVNAMEIPEVLDLMKLPKLLEPLDEHQLEQALQIVKTLELPIPMPKAMQELPEGQGALVVQEDSEEQEVPKFPERPTVAISPRGANATTPSSHGNRQDQHNFDITFVSRNGLRLLTFSFKST